MCYVSRTIAPDENCPPDKCTRMIASRTIAPEENYPPPSLPPGPLPLTIKFPPKIIAPTQANPIQRILRVNWEKLFIVYQYYN